MGVVPVSVRLNGVQRLGLDTAPIIYYVESDPVFGATCRSVFDLLKTGCVFIVSSICYTETLVKPYRSGDKKIERAYQQILTRTPHISARPVSRPIAERAADLRARYNLRMADAIQVATAWVNRCDVFLTNDTDLQRVTELPILLVRDLQA